MKKSLKLLNLPILQSLSLPSQSLASKPLYPLPIHLAAAKKTASTLIDS